MAASHADHPGHTLPDISDTAGRWVLSLPKRASTGHSPVSNTVCNLFSARIQQSHGARSNLGMKPLPPHHITFSQEPLPSGLPPAGQHNLGLNWGPPILISQKYLLPTYLLAKQKCPFKVCEKAGGGEGAALPISPVRQKAKASRRNNRRQPAVRLPTGVLCSREGALSEVCVCSVCALVCSVCAQCLCRVCECLCVFLCVCSVCVVCTH